MSCGDWYPSLRTYILVCCLVLSGWLAEAVAVFPKQEPIVGYGLTNAFGALKFAEPVGLATPPGETNRLFVIEKAGRIMVIPDLQRPTAEVFLDLRDFTEGSYIEDGLLGLAFHPGFGTNGYFFVFRTKLTAAFYDQLSRFQISATNANRADEASEVVFISQQDESNTHNAGDIHFGPDGYLYISVGDDGPGPTEKPDHIQAIDKGLFGGILRIDVDQRPGNLKPSGREVPYSIPRDNPFVGATQFNGWEVRPEEVRTEFYAVGLRNSFRFCVDAETGDLFAGDVGEGLIEEINLVHPGDNFGWPYLEGEYPGTSPEGPPDGLNFEKPLYAYAHGLGDHEGRAVIGGRVYHGNRYPGLSGKYVFGDNVSGHIWALEGRENPTATWLASEPDLASFGEDPSNGDLLVTSLHSGLIRRLVYVPPSEADPLPQTLSDTGIFRNLATLETVDEFVPYEINVSFWSDFAVKRRWFSTAGTTGGFGFSTNGPWTSPVGTKWVKHFDMESVRGDPSTARRLETRVLIRSEQGVYGLSYQWDERGENATLVSNQGLDKAILVAEGGTVRTQVWHFPGRRECLTCHNEVAGQPLGFNTAQLNRGNPKWAGATNQLEWLAAHGYFTNEVPAARSLPRLVAAEDTSWPVEYRARSYLAANCQQCHQPGGISHMLWDARISTPLSEAGIIHGELLGPMVRDQRVLTPHSLPLSAVYARASGLEPWRMPPLGRNEVDTKGVNILQEWIEGIPSAPWQEADLGEVGLSGSASIKDGILALGGAGRRLLAADVSDAFHWISRPAGASSQVVGKLLHRPGTGSVGLMLRLGSETNGAMVALQQSAGRGLEMLRRITPGSPLEVLGRIDSTSPWLRLVRQGNLSLAYHSGDGTNWTLVGRTQLGGSELAGATASNGFFTTSDDTNRLAVAEWSDVIVESLSAPVLSTSSLVALPTVVKVSADLQSTSLTVPVSWLGNGNLIGEADHAPYTLVWTNAVAGVYDLRAVIRYGTPLALVSEPVKFTVTQQPSEIWFESARQIVPADLGSNAGLEGSLYSNGAGAVPSFAAIRFDESTSNVTPVDDAGQPIHDAWGTVWQGSPSIQFDLSFLDFGLHRIGVYFKPSGAALRRLKISVSDAPTDHFLESREVTVSEGGLLVQWAARGPMRFRIEAMDNRPAILNALLFDVIHAPRITLKTPVDGMVAATPAMIQLEGIVEPAGAAIRRLDFFAGGVLLGGQTNGLLPLQWINPLTGRYLVEARVTDLYGQMATSSPVRVEIQGPEATATFAREDRITQGAWLGNYGEEGWALPLFDTNFPPSAALSVQASGEWAYSGPVGDLPALESPDGSYRQPNTWFSQSLIQFDLNLRDGREHQVALYFLSWQTPDRQERVEVIDTVSGRVLAGRTISDFSDGVYQVWNVRGDIGIKVVRDSDAQCLVGGIFLDPVLSAYDDWRSEHFGQAGASLDSIGGDMADPDGDGLPNYLEYALGLNPADGSDGQQLREPILEGQYMVVLIEGQALPGGASVVVETSEDLSTWSSVLRDGDGITRTELPDGRLRTRFQFGLGSGSQRYIRWRASAN